MTQHAEIRTEPDRISGGLVQATIALTCVAIAASAVVVYLLGSRLAHGGGRSDVARLAVEPPADPFALATLHEQHRRDQASSVDRWEWADAAHTRVRMPVELVIERMLGGRR